MPTNRFDCPRSGSRNAHSLITSQTGYPIVKCHSLSGNCSTREATEQAGYTYPYDSPQFSPTEYTIPKRQSQHLMMARPADATYTHADLFEEPVWTAIYTTSKTPTRDNVKRSRTAMRLAGIKDGQMPAYNLGSTVGHQSAPLLFVDFDFRFDGDTDNPASDLDSKLIEDVTALFAKIEDTWPGILITPSASANGASGHLVIQTDDADREFLAGISNAKGLNFTDTTYGKTEAGKSRFAIDLFMPSDGSRYIAYSPHFDTLLTETQRQAQLATIIPVVPLSELLDVLPAGMRDVINHAALPSKSEQAEWLADLEIQLPDVYALDGSEDAWRERVLTFRGHHILTSGGQVYLRTSKGGWTNDAKEKAGVWKSLLDGVRAELLDSDFLPEPYRKALADKLRISYRLAGSVGLHLDEILPYTPAPLVTDLPTDAFDQHRVIQWAEGGGWHLADGRDLDSRMLTAEDMAPLYVKSRKELPAKSLYDPDLLTRVRGQSGHRTGNEQRLWWLITSHFGHAMYRRIAYLLKKPAGKTFDQIRAKTTNAGKSAWSNGLGTAFGGYIAVDTSVKNLNDANHSRGGYTPHLTELDTAYIKIYSEADKVDGLKFDIINNAWCETAVSSNIKYGQMETRPRTAHAILLGNDFVSLDDPTKPEYDSRIGWMHDIEDDKQDFGPLTEADYHLLQSPTAQSVVLTLVLQMAADDVQDQSQLPDSIAHKAAWLAESEPPELTAIKELFRYDAGGELRERHLSMAEIAATLETHAGDFGIDTNARGKLAIKQSALRNHLYTAFHQQCTDAGRPFPSSNNGGMSQPRRDGKRVWVYPFYAVDWNTEETEDRTAEVGDVWLAALETESGAIGAPEPDSDDMDAEILAMFDLGDDPNNDTSKPTATSIMQRWSAQTTTPPDTC